MKRSLTIGDLIEVPEVQTVIRLEEGRTRSEEISRSFVFTKEVASHLTVLADSLLQDRGRGFFLQGDFGITGDMFMGDIRIPDRFVQSGEKGIPGSAIRRSRILSTRHHGNQDR